MNKIKPIQWVAIAALLVAVATLGWKIWHDTRTSSTHFTVSVRDSTRKARPDLTLLLEDGTAITLNEHGIARLEVKWLGTLAVVVNEQNTEIDRKTLTPSYGNSLVEIVVNELPTE